MYQQKVRVNVTQKIDYLADQKVDEWETEAQGNLIVLRSYNKISYTDREGVPIEVKWMKDSSEQYYIVEIIQPSYTLRFNPTSITQTQYQTPQGLWSLDVETVSVDWEDDASGKFLNVHYSLQMNEQPIGRYQFRLTYWE